MNYQIILIIVITQIISTLVVVYSMIWVIPRYRDNSKNIALKNNLIDKINDLSSMTKKHNSEKENNNKLILITKKDSSLIVNLKDELKEKTDRLFLLSEKYNKEKTNNNLLTSIKNDDKNLIFTLQNKLNDKTELLTSLSKKYNSEKTNYNNIASINKSLRSQLEVSETHLKGCWKKIRLLESTPNPYYSRPMKSEINEDKESILTKCNACNRKIEYCICGNK